MVFYLKINRDISYTLSNLKAWIDAIACINDSRLFIICDNRSLEEKTLQLMKEYSGIDISIIESDRQTEELRQIAETVTIPSWFNCACSHLTTFFHARSNGYEEFWNIDADDTFFCVSRERMAEILNRVRDYAREQDIGCFSLDMWSTRNHGAAWSFGVTYTSNRLNWADVMFKCMRDDGLTAFLPAHTRNLDWFFTYLRDTYPKLGIGSFYIENLRFVHYGDDMYRNPIGTGFFHWEDGYLRFPLLFFFYGSKSLGKYKIPKEIVRFDMGISDRESFSLVSKFCDLYDGAAEPFFADRDYYECVNRKQKNISLFFNDKARFVLFGAGQEGQHTMEFLGADRVMCFVDNNRQGTVVYGKPVISFGELLDMDFKKFILLVTAIRGFESITRQLEENGIYNYQMLPYFEQYIS